MNQSYRSPNQSILNSRAGTAGQAVPVTVGSRLIDIRKKERLHISGAVFEDRSERE